MITHVHLRGIPTPDQAATVCAELFPDILLDLGTALLAKAGTPIEEPWEEWFLQELERVTRTRFTEAEQAIWDVLDNLLRSRHVTAPSEMDSWELRARLFDLTGASTARMVGLRVPPDVATRLHTIGFTPAEQLDFVGVAYRMGLVYDRLNTLPRTSWSELQQLVSEHPLSSAERAAIDVARAQAGQNLQPIFDDVGRAWTAERELAPLRRLVGDALAQRTSTQEASRALGNTQRAQGIIRDANRVVRTELSTARSRGAWQVESRRWTADSLIYRPTSSDPCRQCLRLYKQPNGMPRLYRRSEVEAYDAQGYNRGPGKEWVPKIGATHPNDLCGTWAAWHPAMTSIFEPRAAVFANAMKRLGIQEAA